MADDESSVENIKLPTYQKKQSALAVIILQTKFQALNYGNFEVIQCTADS